MEHSVARRRTMVDTQVRPADVTKFPIIDAMLHVPREAFLPQALRAQAYVGRNLALGEGRVVLEPRSFAKLLDALRLTPQEIVLHVGAGGGYGTAVLARLASFAVGLESDPALFALTESALLEQSVANAAVLNTELAAGLPQMAPFDAIVLEGAVEIMPQALLAQLKEGGRIAAIFVQGGLGEARLGIVQGGVVQWRPLFHAVAPILPGFERKLDFAL